MIAGKKWIQPAIAGVIIFIVSTFFYTQGIGGSFYFLENPLRDTLGAKLISERQPNDNIKILKIDNKSLDKIGQWPWDRSVYGDVIDKLEAGGVKAIGLDVVIADPSKDPKSDAALAAVMEKYPNIILPVQFNFPAKQVSKGQLVPDKIDYPAPDIHAAKDQTAHINVFPDPDNKVRKLIVGVPLEDKTVVPAFSVRLANYLMDEKTQIKYDADKKIWMRGSKPIPVNYRNQVATEFYSDPRQNADAATGYDAQSFIDVMDGTIDPNYFQDSIVLIGPFTTGLQDEYSVARSSIKMFGIEIHANMIQSLVDGKFYTDLSTGWGILIMLLMSLLPLVLFERFRGRSAIFIFLGFLIGYIALVFTFNFTKNIFLPFVYPLFALIVTYVWSIISHYLAERKERGRVTDIFGRFVAKSVVDELLASGEDVKLGGSRMDITLIFVDIRGFTPMSEKLEPEQVILVLNEYLDVCTKAIFKFNGTLDKFMGDGVMAMFGAPLPYENHPEMAIRSALEMRSQSGVLEQRLIERIGFGVKFGLGINSGPAIVGNIGSEGLRLDYTAIGDTVNLTARLESNAKPGQILISEATYARVKDKFNIQPVGEIKVKGKEFPVMVYEVMGELEEVQLSEGA